MFSNRAFNEMSLCLRYQIVRSVGVGRHGSRGGGGGGRKQSDRSKITRTDTLNDIFCCLSS